jgi:hypothetical protein
MLEEKREHISLHELEEQLDKLNGYRLFEHGLATEFLRSGTDASRYRTDVVEGGSGSTLAFRFGVNRWVKLAECTNTDQAVEVASLCQQFLYALNRFGEGMHIVEHGLFEVNEFSGENQEKDREEIYQISVVLPNWLIRFESRDFQEFVEISIQQSCPAHIFCNIYWLGFEEMRSFEQTYSRWYKQLSKRSGASSIEENDLTTNSPEHDLKQFLRDAKTNSEIAAELAPEMDKHRL